MRSLVFFPLFALSACAATPERTRIPASAANECFHTDHSESHVIDSTNETMDITVSWPGSACTNRGPAAADKRAQRKR